MRHALAGFFVAALWPLSLLATPYFFSSSAIAQANSKEVDSKSEPLPAGLIHVLAAPRFRLDGYAYGLAVIGNGKQLITGGKEGAILWDVSTGKRIKTLVKGDVTRLTASSKGDLLAVGLEGDKLIVYDLVAGKERFTLSVEDGHSNDLAISADSSVVASGSSSGKMAGGKFPGSKILIWNTTDGKVVAELKGHSSHSVWGLAFHPNGKTLFSGGGKDGTLREWDLTTKKETRRLALETYVNNIAVSADGKSLAVNTIEHGPTEVARVRVLDTLTWIERFRATLPNSWVVQCALWPDGRYVAAGFASAKPGDSAVGLWDTWTGIRVRLNVGYDDREYRVAFLDGGKTLASAGDRGAVRLWNVADGKESDLTRGQYETVGVMAFAPSGKVLASANEHGAITLWDALKGKSLRVLDNREKLLHSLVFSPNSDLLLSASRSNASPARLWKVASGEHMGAFQPVEGTPAFAPDGKTFVAADGAGIRLWDVAKGKLIRRFVVSGEVKASRAVAFSPDGHILAASYHDQKIRLWDVRTGEIVNTMAGLQGSPEHLWFSPDGSVLFAYTFHGSEQGLNAWYGSIEGFETLSGMPLLKIHQPADGPFHIPATMFDWNGGALIVAVEKNGEISQFDLTKVEEMKGAKFGGNFANVPGSTSIATVSPMSSTKFGGNFATAAFAPVEQTIALGYNDGRLLLWKSPPITPRKAKLVALTEAQLRELWTALASVDAKAAYAGRWTLTSAAKQTLPLFRKELRPTPKVDTKQVAGWIAQLDSDSFKQRELAMRDLEQAGDAVAASLRQVLEKPPSEEVRQRVMLLLKKLGPAASGDRLRTLRAIVILEGIGGAQAKAILGTLAQGAPDASVTTAAQTALKRLP
ncbi:MAG TPA: WD40 repeat domain-containing protein [Gemmataceae bacterium]|nr:WD40 repeat domain-containing protein [Gemmataceae bacterium]